MGILDRVGTGDYEIPDRLDPGRTDLRESSWPTRWAGTSLDLQLVVGAMRGSQALPRGGSWSSPQPGQRVDGGRGRAAR